MRLMVLGAMDVSAVKVTVKAETLTDTPWFMSQAENDSADTSSRLIS